MVVESVSAGSGLCMEVKKDIGANLNEGLPFRGKPHLSKGPVLSKSSG